ncbi:MAG: hypothetical protein QW733_06615 [Desulfurococcaceae archaeon]
MQGIHWIKLTFISGSPKGKYANGLDALERHFKYIFRKGETTATENTILSFLEFAKGKILKKKNSRIAIKIILALPNDLKNLSPQDRLSIAHSMISAFVEKALHISRENMTFVIHNDKDNLHAHVVCKALRMDGKPVKYSPSELKKIHSIWDDILKELNVDVYRLKDIAGEDINITLPYRIYRKMNLKQKRIAIRQKFMQLRQQQYDLVSQQLSALNLHNDFYLLLSDLEENSTQYYINELSPASLNELASLNAKNFNISIPASPSLISFPVYSIELLESLLSFLPMPTLTLQIAPSEFLLVYLLPKPTSNPLSPCLYNPIPLVSFYYKNFLVSILPHFSSMSPSDLPL